MEIKVNKEIRKYQENLFFGLSLRQFICVLLAGGAAVGIYFLLKEPLGEETVSWLCIVAAAPLALAGFFNYNGMVLEKFLWAVFRSEFLRAGPRKFVAENIYLKAIEKRNRPRPWYEKFIYVIHDKLSSILKPAKNKKEKRKI